MTPVSLAALPALATCVVLAVTGNGWGLAGIAAWWLCQGLRR